MTYERNAVLNHRGNRVEVTAVHETYDVQVVDENGRVQLDANNQPRWTGGVDVSELSELKAATPKSDKATSAQSGPFLLSVPAGNGGTVSKSPDLPSYPSGSSVTLTAVPDSTHTFSSWSGDATGNQNPLTVTMDRDKTIAAKFTLTI